MNKETDTIYHVTDQSTLNQISDNLYTCASLQQEGFIHSCTQQQLAGVLERYYQGVSHLKLLTIDPLLLEPKLVYENTVGGAELFPHVYGAINMSSVTAMEDLNN